MHSKSPFCLAIALIIISLGSTLSVVSAGTACVRIPTVPEDCCRAPRYEKEAEVIGECVKAWGEQTKREQADKNALQRGCCIAECIINGTGRADLSEAIMAEVGLKEAEAMGMMPDWEGVVKAAAKTCADENAKMADRLEAGFKLEPVDSDDHVCHPKYVFALICTNREYFLNCPEKYYSNSTECQAARDQFAACELYPSS